MLRLVFISFRQGAVITPMSESMIPVEIRRGASELLISIALRPAEQFAPLAGMTQEAFFEMVRPLPSSPPFPGANKCTTASAADGGEGQPDSRGHRQRGVVPRLQDLGVYDGCVPPNLIRSVRLMRSCACMQDRRFRRVADGFLTRRHSTNGSTIHVQRFFTSLCLL